MGIGTAGRLSGEWIAGICSFLHLEWNWGTAAWERGGPGGRQAGNGSAEGWPQRRFAVVSRGTFRFLPLYCSRDLAVGQRREPGTEGRV